MRKNLLLLILPLFFSYLSFSQNVGVGTTTPVELFHVKASSGAGRNLIEQTSAAGWAEFQAKSDSVDVRIGAAGSQTTLSFNSTILGAHAFFTTMGNQPVHIGTNAYAHLTVHGNGNIGVGTITPSEKLAVVGNITATGTINSSSDMRFKTDIHPLSTTLPAVMKLHPFYYNWKKEFPGYNNRQQLGFSAQEVENQFPEVVTTDKDGFKAVDYSRLTTVLVKAVQEQQAQLAEQKGEINGLKKQVEELLALVKSLKN